MQGSAIKTTEHSDMETLSMPWTQYQDNIKSLFKDRNDIIVFGSLIFCALAILTTILVAFLIQETVYPESYILIIIATMLSIFAIGAITIFGSMHIVDNFYDAKIRNSIKNLILNNQNDQATITEIVKIITNEICIRQNRTNIQKLLQDIEIKNILKSFDNPAYYGNIAYPLNQNDPQWTGAIWSDIRVSLDDIECLINALPNIVKHTHKGTNPSLYVIIVKMIDEAKAIQLESGIDFATLKRFLTLFKEIDPAQITQPLKWQEKLSIKDFKVLLGNMLVFEILCDSPSFDEKFVDDLVEIFLDYSIAYDGAQMIEVVKKTKSFEEREKTLYTTKIKSFNQKMQEENARKNDKTHGNSITNPTISAELSTDNNNRSK